MTYPIVKVKNEQGQEYDVYQVDVPHANGIVTLSLDKELVDAGLTSVEDCIADLKRNLERTA